MGPLENSTVAGWQKVFMMQQVLLLGLCSKMQPRFQQEGTGV